MSNNRIEKNFVGFPVQPTLCKTCPFASTNPIELSPKRYNEIYQNVVKFEGNHLCHSVNNEKICRGGRDIQIKIARAFGWISEPTNEAFEAEMKRVNELSKTTNS